MTKAKHTPSHQIRLTPACGHDGTPENPLFWSLEKVDEDGRYLSELAHVHKSSRAISREERDANARLFLSAPDLLEALKDAEALIASDIVGSDWKRGCRAFLKKARAAIAKAKGEA